MKLISRSESLSTPTTAEFRLLKILELSWKLHCTTRKSRYGLDLPHLPLARLFFFEEMRDSSFVTATVMGERYADMLQNCIIPSLADKHLLERTIFMQDGAPPHIARRVKDLLRRSFGDDRVLSRHFHHAWPPRSPDLSPCDYWLWGYLKSQVYRYRPTSLGMLKDNIRLKCLTITPDMLYSAVHNIIPRLQLLLRNDGEHIEHFL
ncbi:uncharacterized protein TNCV_700831 [Trichonephila clavipes]|nr:uncharacterized protein TNCV_700831 [Trichonephila clavipes]